MVLSNRGGGKTFHFTRWGIDDFKKTGKQCAWVRRYDTELTGENGILKNDKFFEKNRLVFLKIFIIVNHINLYFYNTNYNYFSIYKINTVYNFLNNLGKWQINNLISDLRIIDSQI